MPGGCRRWAGPAGPARRRVLRRAGLDRQSGPPTTKRAWNITRAAELLALNPTEGRAAVIAAMLAQVRRQFAAGDTATTQQLVGRTLILQSPCAEASFWQGLCHLRDGNNELAQASLLAARRNADGPRSLAVPGRSVAPTGPGQGIAALFDGSQPTRQQLPSGSPGAGQRCHCRWRRCADCHARPAKSSRTTRLAPVSELASASLVGRVSPGSVLRAAAGGEAPVYLSHLGQRRGADHSQR